MAKKPQKVVRLSLIHILVNRDVTELENQDSSKKKIPIKDAYYQLINNNVLSLKHMESEEAGAIEQQIHQKFLSSREQIMKELESQLYNPVSYTHLPTGWWNSTNISTLSISMQPMRRCCMRRPCGH